MSSEVCPFCGKTYKRLKSHLPHCKVAASSNTPPTKRDVEANQPSPHHLAAVSSKATAKGKKSIQTSTETIRPQTKKDEKASASSPINSTSLPPTTKNKKHKLSDQIKAAGLSSPASPPLSPIVSKPKKQSLRALIEAAKSQRGTLEGEDLPSDSTLSSRTKTKADKDSVKDDASLSLLSADPKDAPKKMSKPKKAAQSPSTTTHTSDFMDSGLNKSSLGLPARGFWVDSEEEIEDLSVNTLKSKITLQDVKSRLGRGSGPHRSSSIQIPAEAAVSCVVPESDRLLRSTSQQTELKPVKKKALKSKQPALVSLLDSSPSQPEPASADPAQTSSPPPSFSPAEGLKGGPHGTGLLSVSPALSQFSSPLHFPRAPQTLPVKVDRVEKLQLEVRKQNAAQHPPEGVVTRPSLGQVSLRDLPEWMACRTPSRPRDVLEMVQRGWQWYYRRYIDVKKGGVAGLGMLLAGYCVISYMWSYPHTKLDRWRKYH